MRSAFVDLVTDRPRRMRDGSVGRVPVALERAVETHVLLAAFHVLLYKHTGQREIVLGVLDPGARRRLPVLELDVDAGFDKHVARARAALQAATGDAGEANDVEPNVGFAGRPVDRLASRSFDLSLSVAAGGGACLDFQEGLFERTTIERMGTHLRRVLRLATARPPSRVRDIDLLGDDERARILGPFNDTATAYPRDVSIHRLFEMRVAEAPDALAVVSDKRKMTYGELNAAANRLAARLRSLGLGVDEPDEPCGLLLPRSPEFVVAMLGVLKAGGAYLPIEVDSPLDRVRYLLNDSGSRLLVATSATPGAGAGRAVVEIDGEVLERGLDPGNPEDQAAATDLAYVMYTSGTTGRPKGVLVTHRNVVRLVRGTAYVELSPATRILQTGAVGFDATAFEVWGALLNGGSLHCVPNDHLLDPVELRRALAAHDITTMWLTSPLFNQLADRDPALFRPLWELLVGGDVLSPRHIAKVLDACPGLIVVNGYGPTENTTFSTTHRVTRADLKRIPIGQPIANSTAYILGPDDQLSPIGLPGELCLGGDGLARGYLNRPELTDSAFVPNPFVAGTRLYRTGDLARWRPDGTIEFLGRRDHQVKVRGVRVELGEIESTLLTHPAVREAIVIARERADGADLALCAYYVARAMVTPDDLRAHLARTLPASIVPSCMVELAALPLNRNGKVDRTGLPDPVEVLEVGADPVGPHTDAERRLVPLIERTLGIPLVDIRRDLRELGLDSLTATLLAARIEEALGVRVLVGEVLRHPTAERLARHLSAAASRPAERVVPTSPKLHYPLTPQQRRLFVEQMKDESATHYNVPVAVDLPSDTDLPPLVDAFARLADRHEVLRTEFVFLDGDVRQRVSAAVIPDVEVADGPAPAARAFVRPFDLSTAPLWRVGLFRDSDRVRLLLDLHHLVTDGFSLGLLFEECFALAAGVPLPEPPLQYRDYAEWVASDAAAERRRAQRRFWLDVFATPRAAADLPIDLPRPPLRALDGDVVEFDLGVARTGSLRRLAREEDVTLFVVLAAAHAAFLAQVMGEPDVTAGTPVSGRSLPWLDRVLGMFANTVCLRTRVRPGMPFGDLLRVMDRTATEAFRHQDYPFEDLVEDVGGRRDYGRHPLFDALISLQSRRYLQVDLGGPRRLHLDWTGPAVFDLNLQIHELPDTLQASWQFGSRIFRRRTVETFRDLFIDILDAALADPATPVRELTEVSAAAAAFLDVDFDL
jgi:lichenysin synthetase B